jgi:hypothetical protein
MKNPFFLYSTAFLTHPNATKWRPGRLGVKMQGTSSIQDDKAHEHGLLS